mgnify:CR=1 FL=1
MESILRVNDNTKIYVACPPSFQTGGTEALHVLAYELRNLGVDAVMFYRNANENQDVVGERFKYFAELMENGKLFSDDNETKWICLNCGHIHNGKDAPAKCPVCKHSQGYFIRYVQGFNI